MKTTKIILFALLTVPLFAQSANLCTNLFNRILGRNTAPTYTEEEIVATVQQTHQYQDQRNELWTNERRCLCCHTTLPYVLNRSYDSSSKASFDKMMELTKRSVLNDLRSPWYDSDAADRSSQPTEAVVNSMTLVKYDMNTTGRLSDVTKKSLEQIFTYMDPDGTIHWLDYNLEPFESKNGENWGNALAVLTVEMARKELGFTVNNPKYDLLKQTLLSKQSEFHLQEKAVLLWANSYTNTVLPASTVDSYKSDIVRKQKSDGSFSREDILGMGDNKSDPYSTAIALIGLISAGDGSTDTAKKAAHWLMTNPSAIANSTNSLNYQSRSLNRPNRPLNNAFSTDIGTSYAALALKMFSELP